MCMIVVFKFVGRKEKAVREKNALPQMFTARRANPLAPSAPLP